MLTQSHFLEGKFSSLVFSDMYACEAISNFFDPTRIFAVKKWGGGIGVGREREEAYRKIDDFAVELVLFSGFCTEM